MVASLLYNLNHAPLWRGEMEVWERRMAAASLDRLLYLRLHRSGWMGREEAQLLHKLIRPGMRIVDVGANVGLYALLMAQLAGPDGSVLAFEPEPNLFAMLVANCTRNAADKVAPIARALGRANGDNTFHRSAFNSGDNRLSAASSVHAPVEVQVVRFDDLGFSSAVDFIKIDVQGHELDVLAGMEQALAANPQVRVLFEFCPAAVRRAGGAPDELLRFFTDREFQLYRIDRAEPCLVADVELLIASLRGNRYINLLASRAPLPESA
ncbi:MAG: FkbM family methyltransferase [Verrucomicrobiaceae bacterium]|nr:FkbM family methyltransferase [Verrucomicrobiaceae bacterium]